ncbi:MAG: PRC-barrel domain-containing protein [Acetobacteraceae bacterium]
MSARPGRWRPVPGCLPWLAVLAVTMSLLPAAPGLAAADPAAVPTAPASRVGALGTVLGRSVFDKDHAEAGHLVDLMVDSHGAPVAAIIDVGGLMGIGARRIAVAWSLLHFTRENNELRIVIDRSLTDLTACPEFRGLDGAEILSPQAARPAAP